MMFKRYNKEVKNILSGKDSNPDWKKISKHHALMLERIQKERLIHLIVTVFVGVCLVLCFLTTAITSDPLLGILTVILLILFAAYILHYRFLENTTQNWYVLEDEISQKISS